MAGAKKKVTKTPAKAKGKAKAKANASPTSSITTRSKAKLDPNYEHKQVDLTTRLNVCDFACALQTENVCVDRRIGGKPSAGRAVLETKIRNLLSRTVAEDQDLDGQASPRLLSEKNMAVMMQSQPVDDGRGQ